MNTLLLNNSEKDIDTAARILRNGGIVAIPTETVYGLAADALNGAAVAKIFKAKGRPMDNPLIVHIADLDDIRRLNLTADFPAQAKMLAEAFWPGPLTIILPKSELIPDEVSAGLDTVAIRFPSHPIANEIIKKSGTALAAPSANTSGAPSPTTAQHCIHDLMGKADAVLDGGACEVGVESTVVSLAVNPPRLLRPGGITAEQLRAVLGTVEIDDAVFNKLQQGAVAASPGMKYKHYAPKANVVLVKGDDEEFCRFVNSHADVSTAALCFDEDAGQVCVPAFTVGKRGDYAAFAKQLFDKLRDIDEHGEIKNVYARCPKADGIGMAVYNRLIRAAGFEVINLEKI